MLNLNLDIETKVIERFIIKHKQNRYLTFIQNDKSRSKFTRELHSFRDFQWNLFREVKGDEYQYIRELAFGIDKANRCYIISESTELDQRNLEIDRALREIIGSGMGTLIVFGDAKMVYYEGEGPNDRWISEPK